MSDFTLTAVRDFPNGTSVGAYPVSAWPAHVLNPSGTPIGAATNSQTMTGGTLTFTGLTAGTDYWAADAAGARYVRFTAGADISEGAPGGEPTGTAGGDLTGTYPNPTVGANKVTAAKASTGTGSTNLVIGNDGRFLGSALTVAGVAAAVKADWEYAYSTYKPIVERRSPVAQSTTVNTYFPSFNVLYLATTSGSGNSAFYFDPAHYAAGSRTTKLRIVASALVNNVAPAATFTFGLFPVTSPAGANGVITFTAGTVVTGSNGGVITTPAANSINHAEGSDFTAPVAGMYALGVTTSGGTTAASSLVQLRIVLQMRQV